MINKTINQALCVTISLLVLSCSLYSRALSAAPHELSLPHHIAPPLATVPLSHNLAIVGVSLTFTLSTFSVFYFSGIGAQHPVESSIVSSAVIIAGNLTLAYYAFNIQNQINKSNEQAFAAVISTANAARLVGFEAARTARTILYQRQEGWDKANSMNQTYGFDISYAELRRNKTPNSEIVKQKGSTCLPYACYNALRLIVGNDLLPPEQEYMNHFLQSELGYTRATPTVRILNEKVLPLGKVSKAKKLLYYAGEKNFVYTLEHYSRGRPLVIVIKPDLGSISHAIVYRGRSETTQGYLEFDDPQGISYQLSSADVELFSGSKNPYFIQFYLDDEL